MKSIGVLLLGLGLSACAVGNKHQYAATPLSITASSTETVAIAVHDQRPYVLDGDKEPDFVGVQRGGFGNPFDVTTESRKPLADDFAAAIATALKNNNVAATIVPIAIDAKSDTAVTALKNSQAGRLLLLVLREWKSDTYTNTALIYDVRLSLYGRDGILLAEKSAKGDEDLGGSVMNPPAHAKTAVTKAFARIISDLLNAPEIETALR